MSPLTLSRGPSGPPFLLPRNPFNLAKCRSNNVAYNNMETLATFSPELLVRAFVATYPVTETIVTIDSSVRIVSLGANYPGMPPDRSRRSRSRTRRLTFSSCWKGQKAPILRRQPPGCVYDLAFSQPPLHLLCHRLHTPPILTQKGSPNTIRRVGTAFGSGLRKVGIRLESLHHA
jgi:hypothetical protein